MTTVHDMQIKVSCYNYNAFLQKQHKHSFSPQFTATAFQLRSRETHSYHCSLLDSTSSLRDHVATTYGVVRDSILNTSKYFHVTGGLVPDVMHDVLEGCAPYVVKELLKYLDQNSIVTLDELNDQIETFPYVPLDARNKPTQIPGTTFSSSDHTLKQKGTCTFVDNHNSIHTCIIIANLYCSCSDVVPL